MDEKKEAWTPPLVVGFDDGSGPEYILDSSGEAIAKTNWGCSCCESPLSDEKRERAKAIVTAVNSHAELVEALRALEKIASRMFAVLFEANIQSDLHHAWADEINRAEALLNRIGGR